MSVVVSALEREPLCIQMIAEFLFLALLVFLKDTRTRPPGVQLRQVMFICPCLAAQQELARTALVR